MAQSKKFDFRALLARFDIIAIVLTILWVGGAILFLFATPSSEVSENDPLAFAMTMIALFMPLTMIWMATIAARSSKGLRDETQKLEQTVDAMRRKLIEQHTGPQNTPQPAVEKKLDEIVAFQKQTESAIATFTTNRIPRRVLSEEIEEDENQRALALGVAQEDLNERLTPADFIRALNFPDNAEDNEGFEALRKALKDHRTAKLVHASQSVLTLLSQDGIYMDDLRPDRARPEIWRKFAQGARGRSVAALAGIRDRSCIVLTGGRMRQDAEFRNAVHIFMREFDNAFNHFEQIASDAEIADFSGTRTAYAFMLLGRITRVFD
ncbi:MAG: hypothetical protein ACPGVK_00590 [Halocynthiibacter sp.]